MQRKTTGMYFSYSFKIKTTQALHNNNEEVIFKTTQITKRTIPVHHEYVR